LTEKDQTEQNNHYCFIDESSHKQHLDYE